VGVIAGDGDASQTAGGFSVSRGFDGLDPDKATDDAVTRAVRLLGATKGPSGRQTVVFDRRVATMVLSVVSGALSGEAVAKGRSFFAGRIGELVGDPVLTLVDDPTDPRAYGAAAYDAEGLACRRNVLIDTGVLRGFLYDTVSASRPAWSVRPAPPCVVDSAGTPSPGLPGPDRRPRTEGFDEDGVLAAVGEGLFVQSMTGVHSGVNPISGDFSVGAEGLMIRDGRSGRAGSGDHRGLDPSAHAAVTGGGRRRRGVAPGHRRRPNTGRRRHADQRDLTARPESSWLYLSLDPPNSDLIR
jgi:PmbA protein